jgi:hypothetical protein
LRMTSSFRYTMVVAPLIDASRGMPAGAEIRRRPLLLA